MRKKIIIFSFWFLIAITFTGVLLREINSGLFLNIPKTKPAAEVYFPEAPKSDAAKTDTTSLEVVEEIVSRLEWGNIAFDTPKIIKFEQSKVIELILSPTKSLKELQSSLKSSEQTESAQVQISNRMQADLSGLGFKIEALTPKEQAVYKGKTTQWKWEVTPTKDEDQNLYLTLSAIINMSNQKVPFVVKTFDKIIKVDVSFDKRISTFIGTNWQWLWASIFVPLSPFLWKLYRDKKQLSNDSDTAD
jgi:hypothetical protein